MTIKRDKILTGLILLIVGILFLAAPTTTTKIIYGAVGVVLAISGILRLIMALRIKEAGIMKTLAIIFAAILLILGVFFLINPNFLIAYDYIIFGLLMVANGFVNILGVLKGEIKIQGSKFLYILLSAVLLIAGIVVLLHPFSAAAMLTRLIGIMLILSGVINLVIALRIRTK